MSKPIADFSEAKGRLIEAECGLIGGQRLTYRRPKTDLLEAEGRLIEDEADTTKMSTFQSHSKVWLPSARTQTVIVA